MTIQCIYQFDICLSINFYRQKSLSPVTAEPQELAPGVESIHVDSLTLLNQLVKDIDAKIQDLNKQQADKTAEQKDLDQELLSVLFSFFFVGCSSDSYIQENAYE